MNPRRTVSTTGRVLTQLRHDHRTITLVLFMPSILIVILRYVFDGSSLLFSSVAPLLLGIIPFTLMFIVSSVAVLRERTSGTLERLLTTPATRLDILLGYSAAFALLALAQSSIAGFVTIGLLGIEIAGSTLMLLLTAILAGVLGMSFGLLFSAFARTEFQAVQFMPAFVLPQLLTCGLFIPRSHMAPFLQYFLDVMPITYVVKAMQEIRSSAVMTPDLKSSILVVIGFAVLALALGAVSLRGN